MSVSVFIRSYRKDFPWLQYCFKSLEMRLHGHLEIILQIPKQDIRYLPVDLYPPQETKIYDTEEPCNGYVAQQISKVNADALCKGDHILFIDSDCILKEDLDVASFFDNGKPMMLTREWANVGDALCWKAPTEKALGMEAPFEYMACMPLIHDRRACEVTRNRIAGTHKCSANAYIARQDTFSEFNAMGAAAAVYLADSYSVRPAQPGTDNYPRVRQFWSHGGLTPEVMAEINAAGL